MITAYRTRYAYNFFPGAVQIRSADRQTLIVTVSGRQNDHFRDEIARMERREFPFGTWGTKAEGLDYLLESYIPTHVICADCQEQIERNGDDTHVQPMAPDVETRYWCDGCWIQYRVDSEGIDPNGEVNY